MEGGFAEPVGGSEGGEGGRSGVFLDNGLEVGTHTRLRMRERCISLDEINKTVMNNKPFRYFHKGVWKVGYYNRSTNLFVGTVGNKVTTVMYPDRGIEYIRDLKRAKP